MAIGMGAKLILLSLLLVSCRGPDLMDSNTNDDGDCALVAEKFAIEMSDDTPTVVRVYKWYAPSRKHVSFMRAAAFRTAFSQDPGHYKFAFEECSDRADKDPRFEQIVGKKP